jgi:hypothetical protein
MRLVVFLYLTSSRGIFATFPKLSTQPTLNLTLALLFINLQNESDKIRYTCAQLLKVLGQSSRDIAKIIVKGLIRIIEDPELNKLFPPRDTFKLILTLTPIEYAYDVLWTLATSGILEKG